MAVDMYPAIPRSALCVVPNPGTALFSSVLRLTSPTAFFRNRGTSNRDPSDAAIE
jgi:hypothetical protein